MDRINTDTKAVDLFGPGAHGFTMGDPQAGVPATQMSADFLNDVQESLLRPITATGQTPAAGDDTQVLTAMGIVALNRAPEYIGDDGVDATLRSYAYDDLRDTWQFHEFVQTVQAVSSGGVLAAAWTPPNNTHFHGSVVLCVVRSDNSVTQAGYTINFHGAVVSGVAIVDHENTVYGHDGGLAIDTVFMDYSGAAIAVKVDTNALPGSKKYNLAACFRVQCVTRDVP